MATKLVAIECISPFGGSYVCELGEADVVNEEYVADPVTGIVTKKAVPRKYYKGLVPVDRWMTSTEVDLWKAGKLADHIKPHLNDKGEMDPKFGARCTEFPPEPFVWVPQDLADDLVKRGLARFPAEAPTQGSLASKLKAA